MVESVPVKVRVRFTVKVLLVVPPAMLNPVERAVCVSPHVGTLPAPAEVRTCPTLPSEEPSLIGLKLKTKGVLTRDN